MRSHGLRKKSGKEVFQNDPLACSNVLWLKGLWIFLSSEIRLSGQGVLQKSAQILSWLNPRDTEAVSPLRIKENLTSYDRICEISSCWFHCPQPETRAASSILLQPDPVPRPLDSCVARLPLSLALHFMLAVLINVPFAPPPESHVSPPSLVVMLQHSSLTFLPSLPSGIPH